MAEKENKTIIFTETKRGSDELTRQMRREGWPGMCIHGDKSQQERDWVLREFRTGRSPILVATDVAARGLGEYCGSGVVGGWRRIEERERRRNDRQRRKEGDTQTGDDRRHRCEDGDSAALASSLTTFCRCGSASFRLQRAGDPLVGFQGL